MTAIGGANALKSDNGRLDPARITLRFVRNSFAAISTDRANLGEGNYP